MFEFKQNDSITLERAVRSLRSTRPKWEGLHAYNDVWDDTAATGCEDVIPAAVPLVACRSGIAQRALGALRSANPIQFGRAQLEAILGLREGDAVNPWEFLMDYTPPFPVVYYDFSGAGPSPAQVPLIDNAYGLLASGAGIDAMELAAALFVDAPDGRALIPFGASLLNSERGELRTRASSLELHGPDKPPTVYPADRFSSFGEFVIVNREFASAPVKGREHPLMRADEGMMFAAESVFSDHSELRLMFSVRALPSLIEKYAPRCLSEIEGRRAAFESAPWNAVVAIGTQADLSALLASIHEKGADLSSLPVSFGEIVDALGEPEWPREGERADESYITERVLLDATLVVRQTFAVLDALYFLDAHNVALEDAPVSRQVRRAVERSGGEVRIAQTVRVAPTKVRQNASKGNGTANYSHRFERAGYVRHVTRGSHAKADLMKPCYRRDENGNLTCPNGCRREVVAPTIIGDESLPFIPKSRIVPGPNAEN